MPMPMPSVTAIPTDLDFLLPRRRAKPPSRPADEGGGRARTEDGGESLQIVRTMAASHNLEIMGFDRDGIDVRTVREIASAIDRLLTKYPIPLRGIAIGESGDDSADEPAPQHGMARWIVLDRATLPQSPGAARRRWFGRGFEQAVFTAVVREYARALDRAGGFRAHQQAWQTVLTDSLNSRRTSYDLLDPAAALIDGFTEVNLRGRRAGKTAKLLHDALANAASGPSTLVDPADISLVRPGP